MQFNLRKRLTASLTSSRLAVPLIIASVVGIVTGFIIVGFIECIRWGEVLFFDKGLRTLGFMGRYGIIVIPAVGGLLVGLLTLLAPDARGHGVPEVMKAIVLRGGRIRLRTVLIKIMTSVLSIGSGASVGREGPAVQIGSGIGSSIASVFKLGEIRIKNLIACGAAAGISAVFNAPITGVMFALEIILRDFGARALSTVVVASVASSIISRIFLGESPAFAIPVYKLWSPWEIFLYIGVGFLAAFLALLFIYLLDRLEMAFERSRLPSWSKPAIGGLLVGVIALGFPQVLGMGFHVIEDVLHSNMEWKLLVALALLKVVATSVSLGSGSSGGTFAPSLFAGAVMGGAVGHLFYGRLPFDVAPPGAYALVGMASVFAGAFHAPVTAILLVFEMTGDYQMILPLMIASVIAASISQLISRASIDTVKLRRQGMDLNALEEVKVLGAIQVRDAMTKGFLAVPGKMPAKELIEKMGEAKDKTFFVVNPAGEVRGMIRRKEVQDLLMEKDLGVILSDDIARPLSEHCFPDDSLSEVAKMMTEMALTQVAVMDPAEPSKVIGLLRSEDVFNAYTQITVRRDEILSRMDQEGTHSSGTTHMRFSIPLRSALSGKAVREIEIPDGVVLTSIMRGKKALIPEGNTVLKGRDKIWAVVHPQSEAVFMEWLKTHKLSRSLVRDA